jgi:ParB-like chromosome segregation protein Spo0J
MSADGKSGQFPERATKATTKPTKVRLSDFKLKPASYCHRDMQELEEENLRPLMDSIAAEGLQNVPEFFRDPDGQPVVTKGHRRITAMRFLAAKNVDGFKPDMLIQAVEVSGGTDKDYLLRSAVDNLNRKDLTLKERLQVIRTLYLNGISVERSAPAFGVSAKTLTRAELLVRHPFMYELVMRDCIDPSNGVKLLEAAIRADRLGDLATDLTEWVDLTRIQIEEKDAQRRAQTGKGLRPNETTVRHYMNGRLVAEWVAQLRRGEPLDEAVDWDLSAAVDPENNKLEIDRIDIDLMKDPLEKVARFVAKVSKALNDASEYLKARYAVEGLKGAQDAAQDPNDSPYDLDFLRSKGLKELADDLALGLPGNGGLNLIVSGGEAAQDKLDDLLPEQPPDEGTADAQPPA